MADAEGLQLDDRQLRDEGLLGQQLGDRKLWERELPVPPVDDQKLYAEGLPLYSDNEGPQPDSKLQENISGPGQDKRRRVLGLRVGMFWLVVAVLALINAGAIGGGVAGGLSAQRKASSAKLR